MGLFTSSPQVKLPVFASNFARVTFTLYTCVFRFNEFFLWCPIWQCGLFQIPLDISFAIFVCFQADLGCCGWQFLVANFVKVAFLVPQVESFQLETHGLLFLFPSSANFVCGRQHCPTNSLTFLKSFRLAIWANSVNVERQQRKTFWQISAKIVANWNPLFFSKILAVSSGRKFLKKRRWPPLFFYKIPAFLRSFFYRSAAIVEGFPPNFWPGYSSYDWDKTHKKILLRVRTYVHHSSNSRSP